MKLKKDMLAITWIDDLTIKINDKNGGYRVPIIYDFKTKTLQSNTSTEYEDMVNQLLIVTVSWMHDIGIDVNQYSIERYSDIDNPQHIKINSIIVRMKNAEAAMLLKLAL